MKYKHLLPVRKIIIPLLICCIIPAAYFFLIELHIIDVPDSLIGMDPNLVHWDVFHSERCPYNIANNCFAVLSTLGALLAIVPQAPLNSLKGLYSMFKKICSLTFLCLFALFFLITPSFAAGSIPGSNTYTLTIHCSFSDSEDNTVDNHMENQFVMLDSLNNTYLIADIDPATGYYHITGNSSSVNNATRFSAGRTAEPGALVITGLAISDYDLIQEQTTSDYMKLAEPVAISISEDQHNTPHILVDSEEYDILNNTFDIQAYLSPRSHLAFCTCLECKVARFKLYFPYYLSYVFPLGVIFFVVFTSIRN